MLKFSTTKLALVLAIVCCCITFAFASYGYPLFTIDSGCFLPVSYFLNKGIGLINPLYNGGIDTTNRFLFYPPLYPVVVAFVMKFTSYFHVAATILSTITSGFILYNIYLSNKKGIQKNALTDYLFSIALVLAIFSFQNTSDGRPEILSKLLMSVFILNNIKNNNWRHMLNGVLIALLGFTSPISAIYVAIITGIWLSSEKQLTIKFVIHSAAGALLILIVFLIVYPYSVLELLQGMSKHSANVIFNRSGSDNVKAFIERHIKGVDSPLSILGFLIASIYIVCKLYVRRLYVAILLFAMLITCVCYFTFKDMAMVYNLYVLAPFMFVIIAKVYRDIEYLKAAPLLRCCILVILFANGAGFLRKTVVFFITKNELVSSTSFASVLNETIKNTAPGEKVAITQSLWPYALNRGNQVVLYRNTPFEDISGDRSIKYFLFQQNYSGLQIPNPLPGFKLKVNGFNPEKIKLWGLSLSNTSPGYQIAIYERE